MTAMKFTVKIRDVIVKRQQKKQNKLRQQLEVSMNQSLGEIECELGQIRQRLQ